LKSLARFSPLKSIVQSARPGAYLVKLMVKRMLTVKRTAKRTATTKPMEKPKDLAKRKAMAKQMDLGMLMAKLKDSATRKVKLMVTATPTG
jgi:hypothetical protein